MSTTMEQSNTCDAAAQLLVKNSSNSTPIHDTHKQNSTTDSIRNNNLTEVESLRLALLEKQNQLTAMETACCRESDRQVELEDSVIAWQDKYDRLYESHKRVQKVNQSLEDKLLKMVDRNAGERAQLTSDVATLSVRLAQANFNIAKLQREIERYKADINLAIQLLQCKPDSFMPQKVSSLPIDIQSKVSAYMRLETNSHSDSEGSTSGIGVTTTASYKVLPASDSPPPAPCPFPPTAMVYSMRGLDAKNAQNLQSQNNNNNNNNNSPKESSNNNINNKINNNNCTPITTHNFNDSDMISPITMAKFLEDELKAGQIKHCDTCQCTKQDLTVLADVSRSYTVATQTPYQHNGNVNEPPLTQLCLRCNSNLNSPSRTNSPYLMKLVKSSDSVISETKSSVSDFNEMDKIFTPVKKDDLMVNPILGHHRLCDRTAGSLISQKIPPSSASMLYPTSSLNSYTSEKYLLDTNSMSGLKNQLRNGYQRRFVDGGGTALEMLGKYEQTYTPKSEKLCVGDDLEDESKPLLSAVSHTNLLEAEKSKTLGNMELNGTSQLKLTAASNCNAAKNLDASNNLIKSNISGSVNSIWSKTSSCEGAKMFETFNRNLIKTIKAENPKYRGPRLCAMRIQQNGQSNILLDNMESIESVTPIIYKRRERLLDEELDDNKDIITSNTGVTNLQVPLEQNAEEWNFKETTTTESNQINANNEITVNVDVAVTDATVKPKEMENANIFEIKTDEQVRHIQTNITENQVKDDQVNLIDVNETNDTHIPLEKPIPNFDVIRNDISSKTSLHSKSCTQSSSISDAIDFQESVILRRQQLSRVAEWVQKNTQQLEQQQQVITTINQSDSSAGTDHQSSFSTLDQLDSVSMEKLSMDSGYKTTPQPQTNGYQRDDANKSTEDSLSPKTDTNSNHNSNKNNYFNNHDMVNSTNTYYRRTTRSGLPVPYTTPDPQNQTTQIAEIITPQLTQAQIPTTTTTTTEQPTCDILNYKYYPSENDKTHSIQAELHTTTQNVDIAQMEYNVKQFLLKQNEWSIRGRGKLPINTMTVTTTINATATVTATTAQVATTTASSATTISSKSGASTQIKHQLVAAQKHQPMTKLFRNTILFNGGGIGPGVGERVRSTATSKTAINTANISETATGNTATTLAQRTETNL